MSRLALAGLIFAGALVAAILIALAGPIYGLAGVLALTLALFMLRSTRWGLLALFGVIGLLPFATLPFKIGFTPTFLDLALLALYFVWIVRIGTRRQEGLIGSALAAPVLVFLVLTFFALANGLQYSKPTVTTLRNFAELVMGIVMFFLLLNNLRTRADLDYVTRLVILAGAAGALIAVVLYVIPTTWTMRLFDILSRFNYPNGANALRYINDDTAQPMRAIGTQIDPNVMGGFLILMAGLTAPQLLSSRPLFPRLWTAVFLLLEVLALYFTHSRGSLVGLAVALLLLGLLRYHKLVLIIAAIAALTLLLPQAQSYVAHFMEGILVQDQATQMRIGEYKDALTLISRYPLFGVGFSGTPEADTYLGVSNLYLLMGEEMGVLGVASFLVVVAGFFASLWRTWRRGVDARTEALLLGLGAAIVAGMTGGFLDHYLFNLVYPHMSTLFWMLLGLGMTAVRLSAQPVAEGSIVS